MDYEPFSGFDYRVDNFFMYPMVLEEYWRELSGSEQKVLDFILRQTIGFRKEYDFISLSQFTNGVGGRSANRGTGLSTSQVRRAIAKLEEKGFIRVERSPRRTSKFLLVTKQMLDDDRTGNFVDHFYQTMRNS